MVKSTFVSIVIGGLSLALLVGCKDQGALPPAPNSTASLSTALDTLFTFPQDSVKIVMSGGIPPYSIESLSSPTILKCSMTDSTLIVVPALIGSVIVQISDASLPANKFTLPVVVDTAVSFANSIQPIFVSSYGCSGTIGGCHGGTAGLFLDNATVSYQNLVNVPAQSAVFPGLMRVNPRDPKHSVLYIRIASNDPAVSMPQGRTGPFNPVYLANVRTWILQGAHFN
jgi:hypothetical protein